MEKSTKLKVKLDNFKRALDSFEKLMRKDLSLFDEVVSDGLMNGRIQKFEICSDLCWKLVKIFLETVDGVSAASPKSAAKEFFMLEYCSEKEYENFIFMIDDRNKTTHIYKENYFRAVHNSLDDYLELMKNILEVIDRADN